MKKSMCEWFVFVSTLTSYPFWRYLFPTENIAFENLAESKQKISISSPELYFGKSLSFTITYFVSLAAKKNSSRSSLSILPPLH